jgi:shikimate 5-dehydrogenase
MQVLAYIAAALIGAWGIAHAAPTKRLVAGFAPITVDNRRVLTQEWLAESFTMWGMATLVVAVTATAADAPVTPVVYRSVAG